MADGTVQNVMVCRHPNYLSVRAWPAQVFLGAEPKACPMGEHRAKEKGSAP